MNCAVQFFISRWRGQRPDCRFFVGDTAEVSTAKFKSRVPCTKILSQRIPIFQETGGPSHHAVERRDGLYILHPW